MTNETFDIMMLSARLEEALLGKRESGREHMNKLPWLTLPEDYSFKVTFPFNGAAARFRVCKTDKPENDISVYLDTQSVLGYFGMPGEKAVAYWEAYPIEGDTQRFAMSEGKELIEAIVKELSTNKRLPLSLRLQNLIQEKP